MADTFESIAAKVRLRCSPADIFLARDWVKNAFRELIERRMWSWQLSNGSWSFPDAYTTGAVYVTKGSTTIYVSSAATLTSTMLQQQIKIGTYIGTITAISRVASTNAGDPLDGSWELTVDIPYTGTTDITFTQTYSIYAAYQTAPSDFRSMLSVMDLNQNLKLNLNVTQLQLDSTDPTRVTTGNPLWVVSAGYSRPTGASLFPSNADNHVYLTGTYTGTTSATYTVTATNYSGGTVTFSWTDSLGGGTTGATVSVGSPSSLSMGMSVTFSTAPALDGVSYTFDVVPAATATYPRYEIWPHVTSAYSLPYRYWSRYDDLSDDVALPANIPGNVLLEGALAACAAWPGTATERNPYFQIHLLQYHTDRFERMVHELERNDDEFYEMNLMTDDDQGIDSNWLQTHTI